MNPYNLGDGSDIEKTFDCFEHIQASLMLISRYLQEEQYIKASFRLGEIHTLISMWTEQINAENITY